MTSHAPGNGPAARLEVRDLVVRRGNRTVLDHLSFRIEPGEAFGLLGPNGAGKTTAYHVLAGLLPADSGRFFLNGRERTLGDRAFRRDTGVVFQSPALDPRLTARENLVLAARLHRVPRREVALRVQRLLEQVGIADRASEPCSKLSGGLRRRVELCRALVHRPSFLILDEPTTGLDEASYRGFWDRLHDLRRRRRVTFLLTTHRPEEAEHCDRLAIVDRGRVVACDTPDRLKARVRGDLLLLETSRPREVAARLRTTLGVEGKVLPGKVAVESETAHQLVPRVVEALPEGSLHAVQVRSTGLGEAFLELTGHELNAERHADEAEEATT